jgi:hypothetical protein
MYGMRWAAGNAFGDTGCASFWEVFERNSTLKKLDLSGCRMTDSSAKILTEAMTANHTIALLDFSFNSVRLSACALCGNVLV